MVPFFLPDSELPVELPVDDPVDVAEHSESDLRLWMASIWLERSSTRRRRYRCSRSSVSRCSATLRSLSSSVCKGWRIRYATSSIMSI